MTTRSVEARRRISAPVQVVWDLITDPGRLVGLEAGITKLEGRIAPGGRLMLVSDVAPGRVFRLRVDRFEPPRRMVWRGGMPFGLFVGRRLFELSPDGAGTALHMREDFSGPMAGMIWNAMPDLQPGMDRLIDGIKTGAEEARA